MDQPQNVAERPPDYWTTGWPQLRQLDPKTTTEFVANGKQYRVAKSISFERWQAYELLQVEVGLARTFAQLQAQIQEAYDLCNGVASGKPVFAELAVLLRDMLLGTTLVGERQNHAVLKMAALFILREGEDPRWVEDHVVESKIDDWRTEGIGIEFFFGFALRSIPGFIEAYRAVSLATSQPSEEGQEGGRAKPGKGSTSRRASRPSAAATSDSSPP